VVELLPSKRKTLGSVLSSEKKKKEKKKRERERLKVAQDYLALDLQHSNSPQP